MEDSTKIRLFNRESLVEKFRNGKRPEESDFEALINSTVNKLDDGISKGFDTGLELAPQGEEGQYVMGFYEKLNELQPGWRMALKGATGSKSLSICQGLPDADLLTLSREHRVGINTSTPRHDLEVAGTIGMQARIGTYASAEVPADGEWHTVLESLKGVQAFEMIAHAHGKEGEGKYAVLQAFLLNAYAGKHGKVKRSQHYFGWKWWHRIRLRWTGTPFDYRLEIRTASDYGDAGKISYHLCRLM